jgi:hypothetical protein
MIDTHGRMCVFCGAQVRVGPFDRPVSTIASSSGARTWQSVTLAGREIHRCPHAAAVSVQDPQPIPR